MHTVAKFKGRAKKTNEKDMFKRGRVRREILRFPMWPIDNGNTNIYKSIYYW